KRSSPALDSLLGLMNFQVNPTTLELYLAEIIQTTRDTENRIGRARIDLLSNSKLSLLKEKEDKLAAAQKKFEEARALQSSSKFWSILTCGISVVVATASIALCPGVGLVMLGSLVATIAATTQGVALATGKGIAGHAATIFGSDKQTAQRLDTGL